LTSAGSRCCEDGEAGQGSGSPDFLIQPLHNFLYMGKLVTPCVYGKIPTFRPEYYTKDWCVKRIQSDLFLWDMRYWGKPKYAHTVEEVAVRLSLWIEDLHLGRLVSAVAGCVHHIEWLLENNCLTIEEVAKVALSNPYCFYPDLVGKRMWGDDSQVIDIIPDWEYHGVKK
jgi:hypothetical protein